MKFLTALRDRNPLLYWFGWLNIIAGAICVLMIGITDVEVLGINAWIKPMKFYFSIAIFCLSMGWFLYELDDQKKIRRYSWVNVVVFTFEMVVITWQAANGRLSHFNISTPFYGILFGLMGVAITIQAIWTGIICYYFFRQKQFRAPMHYIWGIRIGLLLFIIFSFEGGLMASQLSHTVGAKDGSPGLPVVNWSRQYGDLRVAHFFGMHALQLFPILGYFVFKSKSLVIASGIIYFAAVMFLFIRAMLGLPFVR